MFHGAEVFHGATPAGSLRHHEHQRHPLARHQPRPVGPPGPARRQRPREVRALVEGADQVAWVGGGGDLGRHHLEVSANLTADEGAEVKAFVPKEGSS